MKIQFTKNAKNHIRSVRLYSVRRWGLNVANAYINSLRVTITDILALQPFIGRDRSQDLYTGILSFPVESHIIYYREISDGIEILAVLHQTQDPHQHLK